MNKMKEWINRYKYAELSGIIVFALSSFLTKYFEINALTTVVIITYTEFLAYYFTMFYIEQKSNSSNKSVFQSMFILIKEFGPAEIIDLLFSRSFFLYICPILIPNYSIGIVVGKICADILFYALTIISYERLKRKSIVDIFY